VAVASAVALAVSAALGEMVIVAATVGPTARLPRKEQAVHMRQPITNNQLPFSMSLMAISCK
jgi:hypothetical protein